MTQTAMLKRNLMLFSHVVKPWRSLLKKLRRFNTTTQTKFFHRHSFSNFSSFKSGDVEKGLEQQYIESRAYNNNENEVKRSTNQLLDSNKSSESSVYLRRGLKLVACLIVLGIATFITVWQMENWIIYGVVSFVVAIITIIFITGFWRWLYIAAVTTPRDLR